MQRLQARSASPAVPFLDLRRAHDGLKARLLEDIADLIDSSAFVNGSQVEEFEQAFARYCGARSCVGVASGLDALRLALLGLGLEAGDEVVVPANTFIATLEAVTQAGGRPVVVDVDEADYNLSVAAVDAAITARTRFLVPVHLYGQMADMRALERVARDHGIAIVEDACQAHGSERDGIRAGTAGMAAAFSFYPAKNLGAMGDAGALVTDRLELAELARALREHGQAAKYEHEREGYTARLDTIQALVLLHKLPLLDGWNEQRREAARFYDAALADVEDVVCPPVPDGSRPVWHVYAIRTPDPTALAEHLARRGIGSGRHYPQPVHLSPAYAWLGYREGAFPVAEALSSELLSLPLFPGIRRDELEAVVDAVRDFFARG